MPTSWLGTFYKSATDRCIRRDRADIRIIKTRSPNRNTELSTVHNRAITSVQSIQIDSRPSGPSQLGKSSDRRPATVYISSFRLQMNRDHHSFGLVRTDKAFYYLLVYIYRVVVSLNMGDLRIEIYY